MPSVVLFGKVNGIHNYCRDPDGRTDSLLWCHQLYRGQACQTRRINADYHQQNSRNKSAPEITHETSEEPIAEDDEDHAYAMVEDAQAEMEEVRRKEVRDAKFQYASVTFDTFKPTPSEPSDNSITHQLRDEEQCHWPQDEEQLREQRLPSFARNFNPVANRAMLARSYEIVTPMGAAAAGATNSESGTKLPEDSGDFQLEEYDKLVHQERKMTSTSMRNMTGASQRNFSISTRIKETKTNYSQLELTKNPNSQEDSELGVKKIKPAVKKRTLRNADVENPPGKIPPYSLVQKPKAPPLPPRYDRDFQEEPNEEQHYKVPKQIHRRELMSTYDRPSSLVRVAWSCENIGRPAMLDPHTMTSRGLDFYDAPAPFPHGRDARSQQNLVSNEPMYMNRVAEVLQNSASVGSYIDMTGSQVSYI